jgi:CheY-like chemotaxis protein
MLNENNKLTILLVEDDPGHARLIEKNLRRSNVTNHLLHFLNGQEVVDFLFTPNSEQSVTAPREYLILLDLNLPVLSGYQVLERIRGDLKTRNIPVIILTTTDDRREIERCYQLGCSVFVTKPVDYQHFADAIRKLGLFLSIANFPTAELQSA